MAFGQELVILHTTPSIFGKFAMLGVSVEVRAKNILYRFLRVKLVLDMLRGANMILALNELK